jgi:hypothetical protein
MIFDSQLLIGFLILNPEFILHAELFDCVDICSPTPPIVSSIG